MSQYKGEPTPEGEKFISTTYIDLTRHGSRFGGKMEIKFHDGKTESFDDKTDLTPAGKTWVKEVSATAYPQEVLLVHPRGGDEPRHGETGEDIMVGSGKIGPARSPKEGDKEGKGPASIRDAQGKVKGSRMGQGVDYTSAGLMDALKAGVKCINKELQGMVDRLSDEDQAKFRTDREYRAAIRERAQVAGLKMALGDEKVAKVCAENEANELLHCVELSRRGVRSGTAAAIPVVGSGLFAESLLKYALVVENPQTRKKTTGFHDVEEIGGFTKQATAFRIKLQRDSRLGDPRKLDGFNQDTKVECSFTDPERAKLFEGKKVSLDWEIVKNLAQAAQTRWAQGKEK